MIFYRINYFIRISGVVLEELATVNDFRIYLPTTIENDDDGRAAMRHFATKIKGRVELWAWQNGPGIQLADENPTVEGYREWKVDEVSS